MFKKTLCLLLTALMLLPVLPASAEPAREYGKIEKVGDELYEVWFDTYAANREMTIEAHNFIYEGRAPGCTAIYKDGLFLRNLDWYLQYYGINVCELVIHTTANEGRYATVGVAYNPFVTDETYDSCTEFEMATMPFMLVDGMNSEGLMYAHNVCPEMDGVSYTCGTRPGAEKLPFYMAGRSVLDYCATVDEAIEYLSNRNVYMNDKYNGTRAEYHVLLADKERAVVLEFVNNELVVLEQSDLPYEQTFITNHYLYNGGANTGHGMGYERDEIVKAGYASVTDPKSGMDLLRSLRYSLSYTLPLGDGFWYSEYYVSDELRDFPCTTPKDDPAFLAQIRGEIADFAEQKDYCWHTNHSSVYNSADGTLLLAVRENYDKLYSFTIG